MTVNRVFLASILACTLAIDEASAQMKDAPTTSSVERTASDYWRTDRAKFLDSAEVWEYLTKLYETNPNPEQGGERVPADQVAAELLQIMLVELTVNGGIHMETALTAFGALAGFSVQMALREGPIASGRISEKDAFVLLETKDGQRFFSGDLINEGLVSPRQGQLAVWSFVASATASLGHELPDIVPIFKRTASTIGSKEFGTPNLTREHLPHKPAIELLQKYWNLARNSLVVAKQEPLQWPFILGKATRDLILKGGKAIDPTLAAQVVMEAAVPMSRIDPGRIHNALLPRPSSASGNVVE